MASNEYRKLVKELAELRRHLLPRKFDPLGDYADRIFIRAIAYRVLAHGAFEEYLEQRSIEVASKALANLKTKGEVSATLTSLVAFSGLEMKVAPETLLPEQQSLASNWGDHIDFKIKARKAGAIFINYAKKLNHGIIEKNFLALMLPLGIDHQCIDNILLSELNTFGRLRGAIAHSAASAHVTTKPNPEDELKSVKRIVSRLRGLDSQLTDLLEG